MKNWKQEEWAAVITSEVSGNSAAEPRVKSHVKESGPAYSLEQSEAKAAREKAVYYLQFSGKTENELRKKLAEKGFSPASVDYAIDFVKKYRYLDDESYTRRFIEKNGKKKSRKQMMYELSQKGVSREVLELVLEDMPVDEETQILAILEKRGFAGADASREEKQKISAYLARKGFSYDAITTALIQFARKISD